MIRFVSICSGIEAASCAVKAAGLDWKPVAFCEIEKFPCAVLKHHFPDVPNWGDLTKFEEWPDEPVDLVCGGTPCQSFSVAGLRKGMADARGNLALDFVGVVAKYRPRWVLWENVPGVFSSSGGRDFAAFLGGLTGRAVEVPADGWGNSGVIEGIADAYSVAWTVLDAQFFGLAQRRKRVFVIGHLGGWAGAAAVLFDQSCLRGDPAPCRTKGEGTAQGVVGCLDAGEWRGPNRNQLDPAKCIAIQERAVSVNPDNGPQGKGWQEDLAYTLEARNKVQGVASPIAFDTAQITSKTNRTKAEPHLPASTLNAAGAKNVAIPVAGKVAGGEFQPLENAECRTPNAELKSGAQDVGIDGGEVGFALRAGASHSGDKGDGGVHTTMVVETVGPLMTHSTPRGHGMAGVNNQAVASGHVIPVPLVPELSNALCSRDYKGARPEADQGAPLVVDASWAVRRLTPRECERLQGFPDDYTLIPWRGKAAELCPDGPRYKALGNSWAVPCVAWIFKRIEAVDQILRDEVAP